MQRYFASEFSNDYFKLNDDDLFHIKTVMRMKTDDMIEVVYNNELYYAIIDNNFLFKLQKKGSSSVVNRHITLVIPVLKEAKMDLILQKATELGASEIIPVLTERTIIKVDEKKDKKIIRWQKICKEAAEQSKRLDIPLILDIIDLKDLDSKDQYKIICSTNEKANNIKKILQTTNKYDKITLVIGPEGGLSSNEEKMLEQKGFIKASLGNLIMRVETVPIYLLSIINYADLE